MPIRNTKLIVAMVAALLAGNTVAKDHHEKHSHNFPKDVDALHAAIAPLWHAPAGKERSLNVCAQADKLERLSKDVHSGDAKTLLTAIAALKAQCQANPTNIDTAFSLVHDAFHQLAKH